MKIKIISTPHDDAENEYHENVGAAQEEWYAAQAAWRKAAKGTPVYEAAAERERKAFDALQAAERAPRRG